MALGGLSLAASYAGDYDTAVRLARQAGQIQADSPGVLGGYVLAGVLVDAGALAEAEPVCTATLARFRDIGDLASQARLLWLMATRDVQAARVENAAVHLREGLQLAIRIGSRWDVLDDLDCCGHLCAATGRCAEAVTMWAAHGALLHHGGLENWPAYARRQQEALCEAQRALGPAPAQAAAERGAAMSLATAAEYALMLTELHPPRSAPGPGALSERERELVTLVARGCTNAQIAAQLYISVRTVSSHLDRIRDKTGCRRRADLTRLALTMGLV
jgi:DNA-binding CsgD family transcriptional regulator